MPTPPRPFTTPAGQASAPFSSSPPTRPLAGIARRSSYTTGRPAATRSERCELLIGLGEAQRQVGNAEYRQTLLDAAMLALELGDTDRLYRAVLANSRGWTSQVGAVDSERVQALEAAAEALPDDDPRRAQVLALLGQELHYSGDPARCRRLAAEAIEIARAAGDPVALANTLFIACWAIWAPDMLQLRRRLTGELLELAQSLNDPWLSFWAASRQWEVAIETGDRPQAESALTTHENAGRLRPAAVLRVVAAARRVRLGVHTG